MHVMSTAAVIRTVTRVTNWHSLSASMHPKSTCVEMIQQHMESVEFSLTLYTKLGYNDQSFGRHFSSAFPSSFSNTEKI